MRSTFSCKALLLFVLLTSCSVFAQTDEERLRNLSINVSEVLAGAQLHSESFYRLLGDGPSGAIELKQRWTWPQGSYIAEIESTYMVADSREEAAQIFDRILATIQRGGGKGVLVGDRGFQLGALLITLQDRAIVSVSVAAPPSLKDAGFSTVSTRDALVPEILEALEQNGFPKTAPPLSLAVIPSSTRVSETSSVKVDATVSPLGDFGPSTIRIEVLQKSQTLLAQESVGDSIQFTWDGRLENNALAPNGVYGLRVLARDRIGRSAREEIGISVQFGASETLSIHANADSTLSQQNPHRNEGANPFLYLSHRPEVREGTRNPIVGFDLGLKKRKQMSGKGKGVTWFSPVDKKIQNDRPNGGRQWDRARDALLPPSGPVVLLINGETGEIRKQEKGEFGNVRFYSKEGGASPKLNLEFGNGSADKGTKGRELARHVPEAEGFYRIWPSVIRYAEELLACIRSVFIR